MNRWFAELNNSFKSKTLNELEIVKKYIANNFHLTDYHYGKI